MVKKRGVIYSLLSVVGILILGEVIDFGLDKLFKINKSISISIGNIVVISCLVIGLVLYVVFKRKNGNELDTNETPSKPKQQKKSLPREFEIETLNNGRIEWKVIVKTYWNPNEKPQIEDFIYRLKLLEPYCGKCKSSFVEKDRHPDILCICSNTECESFRKKQIYNKHEEINYWGEIMLNQLKGRIRNDDFDKYWDKYAIRYDEVTGGKYDEYN